jgi:adenine-specific DNA-methyltransferase
MKVASQFDSEADLVYALDDVRNLLSDIPDEFVQLILTSPPYNIGKEYENKSNLEQYLIEQREVVDECVRVLKPGGSICWQVGNYVDKGSIVPLDIPFYQMFAEHGLKLRNRIIWHFGHGLHAKNRLSGRYETILWFTKGDDYKFNLDPIRVPVKYPNKKYYKGPKKGQLSSNPNGKNPSDVWIFPNVKSNHVEKTIHPCQFPIELVERCVLATTDVGDWVLDPYMGVGSAAIGSMIHSRRAIGAEIFEKYHSFGLDRINEAYTEGIRIRPMDRPVYDKSDPKASIKGPKVVKIKPYSEIE